MNTTTMLSNTKTLRGLLVDRMSHLTKSQGIKHELRQLGMSGEDLWRSGSAYLIRILVAGEVIEGIVYEYDQVGSTMLVATDRRIIFLEQKQLYISEDEISYDSVKGISYTHFGQQLTVVLHTDVKDYMIRTKTPAGAENLLRHIEAVSMKAPNTRSIAVGVDGY